MSTYEISKSSLLSLKAEILRKQEELTKAKVDNEVKIRNLKKNAPLDLKNKGIEQRQLQDSVEDIDLLKKSREALEAKTLLYDKLSKKTKLTPQEEEHNKRYLVRFDKKSRVPDLPPDDSEEDYEEEDVIHEHYEPPKSRDEEWVEYVDCLGRTRTCLRKDLDYLKRKDKDLEHIVDAKRRNREKSRSKSPEPPPKEKSKTPEPEITEENELLSNDMRREVLRKQWEKEEEDLRNKDDIHYQDILFNEARTHGVGYYGFSKDEELRAKQQEALKKLREDTQQQQKKSQDLKVMRQKQLAARIRAAQNRKRARMGLPPLEDEPEPQPEPEKLPEVKEKEDESVEKLRKNHVRPWDIGKEGVKSHYEHTQEEWVDKQRRERKDEFAPPKQYHEDRRRQRKDKKGEREYRTAPNVYDDEDGKPIYESSARKERGFRAAPIVNELSDEERNDKRERATPMYKHSARKERGFRAAPIVIETSDEEMPEIPPIRDFSARKEREFRAAAIQHKFSDEENDIREERGARIAPPPTYDYYGPSGSKKPRSSRPNDVSESVEAGLKFLREQMERRQSSKREDIFEL